MKRTRIATTASVAIVVALTGACATNQPPAPVSSGSATEQDMRKYQAKLRALDDREAALDSREASMQGGATSTAMSGDTLLPPNARPGECYARLWAPPKFRTVTKKLQVHPEGERLEVIPARYEWTTERVLVSEASEMLEPVPATYREVSEKMLVADEETYWTFGTNGVRSAKGTKAKRADASRLNTARNMGVPNDAAAGQCFAEYHIPTKYETRTEQVVKSDSSQKLTVMPAKYEMVTEKVLVREASEKLVTVPAKYENVTERVLVKPSHTTWKVSECSGGACEVPGFQRVMNRPERLDSSTGEIMCLVEVPAQYQTISKRTMASPPTTRRITIPAEYETFTVRKMVTPPREQLIEIPATYQTLSKREKVQDAATYWCSVGGSGRGGDSQCLARGGSATGNALCLDATPARYRTVTRRVVATPAASKKVAIPAKYKTVKVRKLVQSAQERRATIPAKFQTVTQREKVSEGLMEWTPVLCQVNMTRSKIQEVQRALKKNGVYGGPIDGVVGSQTVNGLQKFQADKGLRVSRYLTVESIKALGVNPK